MSSMLEGLGPNSRAWERGPWGSIATQLQARGVLAAVGGRPCQGGQSSLVLRYGAACHEVDGRGWMLALGKPGVSSPRQGTPKLPTLSRNLTLWMGESPEPPCTPAFSPGRGAAGVPASPPGLHLAPVAWLYHPAPAAQALAAVRVPARERKVRWLRCGPRGQRLQTPLHSHCPCL